jgi:hypothetical protein
MLGSRNAETAGEDNFKTVKMVWLGCELAQSGQITGSKIFN